MTDKDPQLAHKYQNEHPATQKERARMVPINPGIPVAYKLALGGISKGLYWSNLD